MKFLSIGILSMTITLVGCGSTEVKKATPKSAPTYLNDSQLKSLLVGKTMVGDDWTVALNTDGSAIGKSSNSNDRGTYTLQDGLYCSKWKSWGSGNKRCWSLSKSAKGYYGKAVSGGAESFNFTVK